MGYDDRMSELPRSWEGLTRKDAKVEFTQADLDRLRAWNARLKGPDGEAVFRDFIARKGVPQSKMVYGFVVRLDGMERVEALLGWPARSGRLVLRLLLDDAVAREVLG